MDLLLTMQRTVNAKPFFAEGPYFSIAHSNNLVVCAINPDEEVGVDVEWRENTDIEDFRRVFREEEWADIIEANDPICELFRWWVRKESVIKADGRGFLLDPTTIEWSGDEAYIDSVQYIVRLIEQFQGFAACVAWNGSDTDINLTLLSNNNLEK